MHDAARLLRHPPADRKIGTCGRVRLPAARRLIAATARFLGLARTARHDAGHKPDGSIAQSQALSNGTTLSPVQPNHEHSP